MSREANVREVEYLQTLRAALVQVEDLPLAHDRLADLYRARLEAAESARDEVAAAESEALLRAHDRGRHAPWLRGDGALTLVTDPPAEVVLERYVEQDRRLVPVAERVLGRTPFHAVAVPRGSYRLRLRAEGRAEVLYPVLIGRGEHWDGVPPGGTEPWPVALPTPGDLGPDEVYVPAGWMVSGGDHSAKGALPHRRLWVDALVAERFPVTVGRYIEFLNDLVATGHEEEALRVAPRERGAGGAEGVLIFGRDGCGRFVIQSDADGDLWRPDWAMTMVGHGSATAYARWWAARRGRPWRLPAELEWEKVARGADGRFFPWGDFFDATWCLTHDTEAGGRMQLTVDRFPTDESPYGVRGMGGNVRDWCAEAYSRSGPPVAGERVVPPPAGGDGLPAGTIRTVRGGAWGGTELSSRAANRNGFAGDQNYPVFGFRLVRSFP